MIDVDRAKEGRGMNLPEFLVDHPDGEIRLSGHRISLYEVTSYDQEGHTPEMLQERFPSIPLALIGQVLGFYQENRASVDAYVAEKRSALERLEASNLPSPAQLRLRQKLEQIRRTEVP
jgi:uncharacterized protein (DUF433 family)